MKPWVTSSPVKVGQKLEEKVEERLNDGEEPISVDLEEEETQNDEDQSSE